MDSDNKKYEDMTEEERENYDAIQRKQEQEEQSRKYYGGGWRKEGNDTCHWMGRGRRVI